MRLALQATAWCACNIEKNNKVRRRADDSREAEETYLVLPFGLQFARKVKVKLKRRSSYVPIVLWFAGEAEEMWLVLADRLKNRAES